MGRTPCCSKVGLHRGAWSSEEDKLLINHIQTHGEGQWRSLPSKAGLLRCGKSCRLRWMNYLRPGIKRGNFTSEENDIIIRLRSVHGNRWSLIATELPGRTDNEIKNHWNAHLRKTVENPTVHRSKPLITKPLKKKRKSEDRKPETKSQQKSTEVNECQQKSTEVMESQQKSTEVKIANSDSDSTLEKNEGCENGGASSSCTVDFCDDDFDFFGSDWTIFLEGNNVESRMDDGDEGFLMDGCDLSVGNECESLKFENLYHEYLNLLDCEDLDEGN